MADHERPNPEELLELVKREEKKSKRGKLKIFLGMAAGVGKTYAMLESVQRQKADGVDIVIGVVETHGRKETAKLLEGIEVIPPIKIKYKGSTFNEIDIDAILKRKPEIVVIDELAHSNIEGSRHFKRWQDVMEILDNGISVYTTLNVQHIESRSDLVEGISGIKIRETVPDIVIDGAASIELIDITPQELLQRLKEGKVYLGNQSEIAAHNFFQEDRLTALREIVMRYAAEKVDHDLHGMFSMVERPEAWKTRERLLVAISHNFHSQKLIRITRRLAFTLNAPWIALHVDDGRVLDEAEQKMLANNLALARDLGAEVMMAHGEDTAEVIHRIARQKSVTQIVIGRSPSPWHWLFRLVNRDTLLDKLSMNCSDIDLHVIRKTVYSKTPYERWFRLRLPKSYYEYLLSTLFVAILTFISGAFLADLSYHVTGYIFLLGILSLSLVFKKGPIIFASILYALIWYFYFIPGGGIFPEVKNEDVIMLTLYLMTALIAGVLIDREKKSKELLLKRERSLEALYEIVQDIASGSTVDQVLSDVKKKIGNVMNGQCEIILKKTDDGLIFDEGSNLMMDEKEQAAANWVFLNGKDAGWSTSTLPLAKNFYMPLKSAEDCLGVLAFHSPRDEVLGIEEKSFLYTVGHQLAIYVERVFSEEKTSKLIQHRQMERIYQSILTLISDLLEGPLLIIQDNIKKLVHRSSDMKIDEASLEGKIDAAAKTLVRILENISAMVNLNAGITPLHLQRNSLIKLVHICHRRMKKNHPLYEWVLKVDETMPNILFDYDLIESLFYNLAFHAVEYALPESTIQIDVKQADNFQGVSIACEGQTIPLESLEVAFEKFYRNAEEKPSGLGFGFGIARAITNVHNGKIEVQHHPKGGMIFSFYLPVS